MESRQAEPASIAHAHEKAKATEKTRKSKSWIE